MKNLSRIFRIFALLAAVGLLLAAGESDSSASPIVSQAAVTSAPTSGIALVLGAYGFLIMLRHRSLR